MIDRRKHPRLEKVLPIILRGEAFRLVTETKNISCSGAYCQVPRFVPAFSKLTLTLEVPVPGRERTTLHEIRCEGVVVRSGKVAREDGGPEKYFVAIYFSKLKPVDREKLNHYVTYHLTHHHA